MEIPREPVATWSSSPAGRAGSSRLSSDLEAAARTRAEASEAPLEVEVLRPGPFETARRGVEELARDRAVSPEMGAELEAIINAEIRPAIDILDGTFTVTHPLWTHLATDTATKERIEAVVPSIGRIELPGNPRLPYGGTGFVVGDGLIMTNRHVAAIFAQGLGDRNLTFVPGNRAGIDFLRERDRPTGPTLMVRRVVMIHPYWDMAILSVDGLTPGHPPLRLALDDARELGGREIAVVGYPAFDPRNPAGEQHDLFGGRYGVKRLQPGELQGTIQVGSFGKLVSAASHDCSTLGGNSGSAVVDLASGEVVALHFGGRYHEENYSVPSAALARDGRVVDAGVRFAGTPAGGVDPRSVAWWERADSGEMPMAAPGPTVQSPATGTAVSMPTAASTTSSGSFVAPDGSVSFEIPLRVTISIGAPSAPRGAAREVPPETISVEPAEEAFREPFHDADYASRYGYDSDFLDAPGEGSSVPRISVPLPEPKDQSVVARTRDDSAELNYQNFSIVMHRDRRLALVCASNVTAEPALRQPEPGRDYSRRGLGDLGRNDRERWFLDPRLESKYQLPDAFFTKDRQSFDKGHIVRRDDVAWGDSYDLVRRANGDTFHVTNCAPQVAGFNRSQRGEDNWGDLENQVLADAVSERLCVFAGPVLDPADEVFVGAGEGGTVLRAKVPKRFWKLIAARTDRGLATYGFVLQQDLDAVDWEFTVPAGFVPAMYPISDIAEMTGLVFDPAILAADQFDTVRGGELAFRCGVHRR